MVLDIFHLYTFWLLKNEAEGKQSFGSTNQGIGFFWHLPSNMTSETALKFLDISCFWSAFLYRLGWKNMNLHFYVVYIFFFHRWIRNFQEKYNFIVFKNLRVSDWNPCCSRFFKYYMKLMIWEFVVFLFSCVWLVGLMYFWTILVFHSNERRLHVLPFTFSSFPWREKRKVACLVIWWPHPLPFFSKFSSSEFHQRSKIEM